MWNWKVWIVELMLVPLYKTMSKCCSKSLYQFVFLPKVCKYSHGFTLFLITKIIGIKLSRYFAILDSWRWISLLKFILDYFFLFCEIPHQPFANYSIELFVFFLNDLWDTLCIRILILQQVSFSSLWLATQTYGFFC